MIYIAYENLTMTKDTQINLRLESETNEELRKIAKIKKITVSELINHIINQIVSGEAMNKDTKIQVLENEIRNLRLKFEKQFDKKMPKTHRVSIALTDEEFFKLQKQETKTNMTKSKILRQLIHGHGKNIKQLT